jgi:MFS family permease
MAPLALIVIMPGSRGAIVAAGYTAGVGIGAAWRGRAIDRAGHRTGLRREELFLAAAFAVLSVAIAADGPTLWIVAAAVCAGVAGSAVGVAHRSALVSFVPGKSLSSAYTIDAVLTEVSFVVSPLIFGLFVATTPAYVLFGIAAGLAAGSYVAGSRLPGTTAAQPATGRRDTRGWLMAGAPVFAITGVIGLGYGLLMAGLPARLIELEWSGATAATLFAVMSAASAVAALTTVKADHPRRASVRWPSSASHLPVQPRPWPSYQTH